MEKNDWEVYILIAQNLLSSQLTSKFEFFVCFKGMWYFGTYLHIQVYYISFCLHTYSMTYRREKITTRLRLWFSFNSFSSSRNEKIHLYISVAKLLIYRVFMEKNSDQNSLYVDISETWTVIIHCTIIVFWSAATYTQKWTMSFEG